MVARFGISIDVVSRRTTLDCNDYRIFIVYSIFLAYKFIILLLLPLLLLIPLRLNPCAMVSVARIVTKRTKRGVRACVTAIWHT